MLPAQLRNRCASFGLLEYGHDLALRKTRLLHVELPLFICGKFYLQLRLISGGITAQKRNTGSRLYAARRRRTVLPPGASSEGGAPE